VKPAPVVVLDVVGLTPRLLRHMPRLAGLGRDGFTAALQPVLPAVTCSVQASLLTGGLPRDTGIVGNGWYFRDLAEVWLWRQSNHLVAGDKIWDVARRARPSFRCAKLFWWYNMYSGADLSVTPRPVYFSDGRKEPGLYTRPHDLEYQLEARLGRFPLFEFWGPKAGLRSSEWIAAATLQVFAAERPDLTLSYLPHLDYDLQRHGGSGPRALRAAAEIDRVAGDLCDALRQRGARVVVLSEYGITDVTRPVHVNRALRRAGLLSTVRNAAGELIDFGASRAFAVVDHQLAHVYVQDRRDLGAVRAVLAELPGVAEVLDDASGSKRAAGLDHPRSGELVAIADGSSWFTYYHWLDDAAAPDFARCVDIHRKPGYDPAELFFDRPAARLRAVARLAQKKLGLRYRMDVVPLDGGRVRGSHGRLPDSPEDGPVLLCSDPGLARPRLHATEVHDFLLDLLELRPGLRATG
jgi:predicted AlkP superfamily pyrophosphatase or phosphodiesterase